MDNVQGMKQLDNESVDLVVTSPPYDNLRNYNGFSFDIDGMIGELLRIVKLGGVIVWIVSDATQNYSESGTSFRQALKFMEKGFNLHDTMIWCKDGGGAVGSNLCYTQNFEYMFVFSKGKPKSVNLICDKKNLSFGKKDGCLTGRRNANGEHKSEVRNYNHEYSRRNNWWRLVPQAEEGSSFHPAVFPEILVRDHIISWSNENDVVLDPFMGSGTTAKVARALGRKYIGFEISQEYVDLANKRLQETKTLFD
jgi:site-specific DNA-methyltransferase (adenine-specific)